MIYFIYVLKFGGSVLTEPSQIEKAIKAIQDIYSKGNGVVLVVSALKGETNRLDAIASSLSINDSADRAEIISMGERVSARIMTGALKAKGINAVLVDPSLDNWPVYSSGDYLDATVDMEKTERAAQEKLLPLIKAGNIPVVCGFIGVNEEGKIQTLGRGGSDTTAVVLGKALGAKEVVLFKDVGKAMSGDPKKAQKAIELDELNAEEALALSAGGSGLIHYKAFKYLSGILRITSVDEGLKGGTIISPANGIGIYKSSNGVSMVTIIPAAPSTEVLNKAMNVLKENGVEVNGVVINDRAVLLYTSSSDSLYQLVHDSLVPAGLAKAVSVVSGLSEITVKSFDLEETPGYLHKALEPLAGAGINVYGVTTATSTIKIYVSEKDSEASVNLIKDELKEV